MTFDIEQDDDLDTSKASDVEVVEKFPAIQVSHYKPQMDTLIKFCFSPESVGIIKTCPLFSEMALKKGKCFFPVKKGEKPKPDGTTMYIGGDTLRIVVLAEPKMLGVDKRERISPLIKGEKFEETGRKTIARPLLAIATPEGLLLNAYGEVQVFTLKLISNATGLIRAQDKERKTFETLNQAINAKHEVKGKWLAAYYSVEIKVKPNVFSSKNGEESSVAASYELLGNAKKLSEEDKAAIERLVSSQAFIRKNNNPFNLDSMGVEEAEETGEVFPDSTPQQTQKGDRAYYVKVAQNIIKELGWDDVKTCLFTQQNYGQVEFKTLPEPDLLEFVSQLQEIHLTTAPVEEI